MMNPRSLRYPGVRPFETHERHLFFGRSRDIEELYDLILLERLTVLFAKSGYGKSSLLKAGIIPKVTDPDAPDSRQYRPIELRFGTYVPGKSAAPLEVVAKALEAIPVVVEAGFLAGLTAGTRLWHHFKMRQGAVSSVSTPPPNGRGDVMPSTSGTARFLLIFDQFEEFFSYPEAEQAQFRAEMAELLYEEIPQDVRLAARAGTREQRAFLATPFDAKVVFSLRADRLSLLDGMKDRLPAILHKRYELKALDEQQAVFEHPAGGQLLVGRQFADAALVVVFVHRAEVWQVCRRDGTQSAVVDALFDGGAHDLQLKCLDAAPAGCVFAGEFAEHFLEGIFGVGERCAEQPHSRLLRQPRPLPRQPHPRPLPRMGGET